jgi:hypothetical protein
MTLSEDGVRAVCSQPVKIYATPTDRICPCFPWHHRHHEAHTLMSLDNVMMLRLSGNEFHCLSWVVPFLGHRYARLSGPLLYSLDGFPSKALDVEPSLPDTNLNFISHFS